MRHSQTRRRAAGRRDGNHIEKEQTKVKTTSMELRARAAAAEGRKIELGASARDAPRQFEA
jgi:hypothetical protein